MALGDRMYMAYSSKDGHKHWGTALADFSQHTPHEQSFNKYLMSNTTDHLNVKIARYGSDQLLISWLEKQDWKRRFQLYDGNGKPLGPAEVLPVRASPRADMKTLPSGDVVWAHAWGANKKILKIIQLQSN